MKYIHIRLKEEYNKLTEKETYVNQRKKSTLKYSATDAYVELDIWFPSLSVCFEFQV